MITVQMSREQFESKRKELADKGFQLVGDKGEASGKGCTVSFDFNGSTLNVDLVKAPFGLGKIYTSKIKNWLQS
jgi:hypothetical protein